MHCSGATFVARVHGAGVRGQSPNLLSLCFSLCCMRDFIFCRSWKINDPLGGVRNDEQRHAAFAAYI